LENRKTNIGRDFRAVKEARALGDLSENSEYDDAKNAQAEMKPASWKSKRS
jgi:transcription elongation GreA/GreB family factor